MWISRGAKGVLEFNNKLNCVCFLSNKSAWITKIRRSKYLRMYPTRLVLHDGATLTIRHFEPRRIIKLPLDISTVSEAERLQILERRKPKKKVVIEDEIEDTFDSNQYIELLQKQRTAKKI